MEKQQNNNVEFIKGIKGLAKLIGCSETKALELKDSGRIPYLQDGKIFRFDPYKVIEALEKKATA